MPRGWSNPDTCISLPAHGTNVEEEEDREFFSGNALAAAMAPCLVAWARVLDMHPLFRTLHFHPSGPKGFETWKLKKKEMSVPQKVPQHSCSPSTGLFLSPLNSYHPTLFFLFVFFKSKHFLPNWLN